VKLSYVELKEEKIKPNIINSGNINVYIPNENDSAWHGGNEIYFKNSFLSKKNINLHKLSSLSSRDGFIRIKIEDKTLLLECRDNPKTSCDYIEKNSDIFEGVDFIFPLQFAHKRIKQYSDVTEKFGIKVFPWIYGCHEKFKLGKYTWKNDNKEYIANVGFGIGRTRKHRLRWIEKAKEIGGFYYESKWGNEYVEVMKRCAWGLSLMGGGIGYDAKCYRECEFLSMGFPLALNYKPCYPFPFYPNVHYLYLNEVDDLEKLRKERYFPLNDVSRKLWNDYFSPDACVELLIKIVLDEKYQKEIPTFWNHFTINKLEIDKFKNEGVLSGRIKPSTCSIKI